MRSTLSCLIAAVLATSVLAQDPEEIVVVGIVPAGASLDRDSLPCPGRQCPGP